jgi:hypothetical protein
MGYNVCGVCVCVFNDMQGYFLAFMIMQKASPEILAEEITLLDSFTLYETVWDGAVIAVIGIICGLGGSMCVGWNSSRSWRVALSLFTLGSLLLLLELLSLSSWTPNSEL